MKLRVKGNSIRLRLTQSEVARLGEAGEVTESVDFGSGGQFIYSLVVSELYDQLNASFENGFLRVTIPKSQAFDWIMSEKVGLETRNSTPTILIEKDFACITERPDEDESDMFPNPGTTACVSG